MLELVLKLLICEFTRKLRDRLIITFFIDLYVFVKFKYIVNIANTRFEFKYSFAIEKLKVKFQ